MTAAPMPPAHEPLPGWLVPPPGGFIAEDLDRLPDLPPHTELIDGSLVFVSPQMNFHALVIDLLVAGLRRFAPGTLRVRREMTVTLDRRQRPEPDLIVVHASSVLGPEQTTFRPDDVVLAVEVVSPDSVIRDRERKPQLYARAGIPHFWRVENVDSRAVVYVYELDPATRAYAPTGIHHDRLKLTVPFDIDVDLTEYTTL
ncbi:Uma2 family endonuclease [Nocardia wallacei]|uniref:Uma2 family endonuclease n=1 Tax=Nocardia wallacei TaxID=480035 RepID=UPI00245557FE|nr:Uma2 family endonuclease [Nocardia wallacei]